MPITANYSSASFTLSVVGTSVGEAIAVSRTAAGALLVNAGAVAITGGSPTVANTSLITVAGGDGDDIISLDETNGAMPKAELYGGIGTDSLTGGSGNDILAGEVGNDILLGKGGFDQLYGGADNDTLTGGDGDDQMFGEAGNDRMIWNPGDDSDLMEGGADFDTAEVNAGNGAEVLTITANGTRVRFDRVDPAPFTLDIGTTESLVVNGNGGDDSISTSGNLAALIALTIDGGAGNDTILGGNGADFLIGGDDNDFIDGNQGNDTAFLGNGNDTFNWDPGDGSDIVEGQAGADLLAFNASAANELIDIAANGGRVRLFRNVGNINMDVDDVESFTVNAGGGIDGITVNDLTGTDLTQVTLNLAGTIGGSTGDSQVDTVTVNGSAGANTITLTGAAGTLTIAGLAATVTMNQVESTDRIIVQSGDGNDIVSAAAVSASIVSVTLDGGAGNDELRSGGDGTYLGGTGDDLILAGLTNSSEVLDGGDGIDTLDTRTWGGLYTINLVTGVTNYSGESFVNFENLITGEGDDTITGTAGANEIRTNGGIDNISGGDGNDYLDGGAGADTLNGGTGNDFLVVDAGDVVVEAAGGGTDNVLAGSSYLLNAGAAVEFLSTTNHGGTANIDLTGNEFGQIVIGNAGSNVLRGGGGVDVLQGLGGNDYLYVDSDDFVIEAVGGGTDNVLASSSFTLNAGQAVEFLSTDNHAGTAAINLTGNEFGQLVIGNAGSNILRGGGGVDVLQGLGGNDFLFVDSDDAVLEAAGGGTDNVLASSSFTLNAGQEIEFLSTDNHGGTAAINLTGNEFGQVVIGNAGSNILDGGGGADVLQGLGGNDFLFVDANDAVIEAVGGGTDNVLARTNFALNAGQEVEFLSTDNHGGTAAINLVGNEFGQTVIGNAGANIIDGGRGADNLQGLGGNDVFAFTTGLGGGNIDNILDFSAGDRIGLDDGLFVGIGGPGAMNANAFFAGAAAHDADDRIIYDATTGNLYFDADGSGAGAQVLFANVIGHPTLSAGDFSVI